MCRSQDAMHSSNRAFPLFSDQRPGDNFKIVLFTGKALHFHDLAVFTGGALPVRERRADRGDDNLFPIGVGVGIDLV
jgi:hypothetical protein